MFSFPCYFELLIVNQQNTGHEGVDQSSHFSFGEAATFSRLVKWLVPW